MPDIDIILEFPEDNAEIDVGYVISFDNISGYLPVARLERSGLVTAEEAHNIWNEA